MNGVKIRKPAVAGMFYPDDPEELRTMIDTFVEDAHPAPFGGKLVALILPHAGYPYSGQTAAFGYKLLAAQPPDVVAIISPSHREYFQGISIYDGDEMQTPLGRLSVDKALREQITSLDPRITAGETGHRREHAIEVHLPFLQRLPRKPSILPIVMGDQSRTLCFVLGEALAACLKGRNAVIIASSDLSHYHTAERAGFLDTIFEQDIAGYDYEKLMRDLETERTEACGGGPSVSALLAGYRLGARKTRILHRCHSGDITGDNDAVVGYLSAVAYQ